MLKALKWLTTLAGIAVGAMYIARTMAGMREQLQDGLARAESVTDHTRQALEETQSALRATRDAL